MVSPILDRDTIAEEACSILSKLRNTSGPGANKLADVKNAVEKNVSLEFNTYFFFLRKHHYISMDRDACLQLTPEGEKILDGDNKERFLDAVKNYFSSRLTEGLKPSTDIILEEDDTDTSPPPIPSDIEPVRTTTSVTSNSTNPSNRIAERRPRINIGDSESSRSEPMRSATADTRGQELDLRYAKYDALGQGPLGTVYRGRHSALGLDVVIKELKDIFGYFSFLQRGDVIKRLKREICAQALVRHPSVVSILDQNCDVNRPYYVLEICMGGNLRNRLDQCAGKGLPPDEAIRYFLQLCYALRAAHSLGLTHCNIKPENVLFDHMGNIKLADFGLNRVIEVDPAKGMPQVFVGTGGITYMSPEQLLRASKELDVTADIYSLGILFYEMLTGQLPGRRSPMPSAINSKVPSKVDSMFDKMTQDHSENRYPDINALLSEFYSAFDDGSFLKKGDMILSSDIQETSSLLPDTTPS